MADSVLEVGVEDVAVAIVKLALTALSWATDDFEVAGFQGGEGGVQRVRTGGVRFDAPGLRAHDLLCRPLRQR